MSRVVGHQRSHLSIGEVLSLLQDEFPDVTISKIRFLESQGLLDPERTPSGYRKFYEYDIERLRWILRQQKDHYLPLKVIKDRLDRSPGNVPGADTGETPAVNADDTQAALPLGSSPERAATPSTPAAPAAPAISPRIASESAEQNGRSSRPTPQAAPRPPAAPRPTPSQPAVRRAPAPARPRPPQNAGGGTSSLGASQQQQRPAPAPGPKPAAAAASPQARPAPQVEVPRGATGFEPSADAITLDVDELAEASGLSVRDIRDLERFGLIEPREVGDKASYDGDALVIARTAAGFLQHGIEARHMRTYKVAADREAGLFEQIVSPVLKQRNPEARTRATRTVTELIRLGEVMRGVLLRRELRDHLG